MIVRITGGVNLADAVKKQFIFRSSSMLKLMITREQLNYHQSERRQQGQFGLKEERLRVKMMMTAFVLQYLDDLNVAKKNSEGRRTPKLETHTFSTLLDTQCRTSNLVHIFVKSGEIYKSNIRAILYSMLQLSLHLGGIQGKDSIYTVSIRRGCKNL